MSYTQTVYVYSIEQDKSFPVTDGLSDVTEPNFDRSGKYLYFFASTDAGPTNNWFSLENADNQTVAVDLARGPAQGPAVAAGQGKRRGEGRSGRSGRERREGGRQEGRRKEGRRQGREERRSRAEEAGEAGRAGPHRLRRDREPHHRPADQAGRAVGAPGRGAGQVFFLREADGKKALQRFDLKDRKTETLLPEADDFDVSFDGKKILYRQKENWAIGPATGKSITPGEGKLKIDAIEVKVDPRAEWPQIFHEAWRINRDYFYDPNMHGVDWPAMEKKYGQFLPDLAVRADLNRVIQWMCSELSVGHHRGGGGDTFVDAKTVPGGLLGADYEVENGRYRFKKVYGGLNWNPELRSPLTEPGVNVKAGEYLLAVQGRNLAPPANLYSFFENTAGKSIEITVGPNADGTGSRTVTVVPVENELALRNRDWVEGNLRKVDAATGGRVAYVYVPNTAGLGHTYFKRYFFPQSYKDAVIVDERFNGGGSVADYYIDILRSRTSRGGPCGMAPT